MKTVIIFLSTSLAPNPSGYANHGSSAIFWNLIKKGLLCLAAAYLHDTLQNQVAFILNKGFTIL